MNSRRVKRAFVANQQNHFQVPTSVPCDSFGVTNFFEARFVHFLVRWLFANETPRANPAFMEVVEVWGARVSTYNVEVSVRHHRYEHGLTSHLRHAIGADDMQVLM